MSYTPTRSHVLLTLGVLFTIGGATRFLPDALAFAEQPADLKRSSPVSAAASTPAASPVPRAVIPPTGPLQEVCFNAETASLLKEDQWLFETERDELKQQTLALQEWELELQRQTADLKALQATLEARWQEMQADADRDVKHLAQMYSVMKPDQAAGIFNQMDPGFAAGFLRLMPSDQAGLILAAMEAQKAYVVSVRLASMNDDVRHAGTPAAN